MRARTGISAAGPAADDPRSLPRRALNDPKEHVIKATGHADEARKLMQAEEPDLVLLDLSMPRMDGMDAIREIRKGSPETKILALTVHKAEEYVLSALQAGANGYALKDATHEELVTAIRSVLAGKRYLSPGVSEQVIQGYLAGKRGGEPKSTWASVTRREREVLKLIASGLSNKEIAEAIEKAAPKLKPLLKR